MRSALYLAALSASRHNPALATFCRRLIAAGKAKKSHSFLRRCRVHPIAPPWMPLPRGGPPASGACMSVNEADVRKIALLARSAVTESQVAAMVPELNNILGWIEQLGEVDTSAVAPMTAVIPNALRLRADVVSDGGMRDAVLANAPVAEHGFFGVPKVIE